MSGRRRGRSVDAVEPAMRELLREFPAMPATVIAERIGWTRSMTVLQDRVARAAPVVRAAGSVSAHRATSPGELAQWDLW